MAITWKWVSLARGGKGLLATIQAVTGQDVDGDDVGELYTIRTARKEDLEYELKRKVKERKTADTELEAMKAAIDLTEIDK